MTNSPSLLKRLDGLIVEGSELLKNTFTKAYGGHRHRYSEQNNVGDIVYKVKTVDQTIVEYCDFEKTIQWKTNCRFLLDKLILEKSNQEKLFEPFNEGNQIITVKQGIAVLKSLSENFKSGVLQLENNNSTNKVNENKLMANNLINTNANNKHIFISHSSKDKNIVTAFVDKILRHGIGINKDKIYCTSIESMGIKNGEDMRNHIFNNMKHCDYAILLISNNYNNSSICLNEMGAVWACDLKVRFFISTDIDYEKIGWLSEVKKANKVDNTEALSALCQELQDQYSLSRDDVEWQRQLNDFLLVVRANSHVNKLPSTNNNPISPNNLPIFIENDWKLRYKLCTTLGGNHLYALLKSKSNDEVAHWLCSTCFNKNKKIILHNDETYSGAVAYCPECRIQIQTNEAVAYVEDMGKNPINPKPIDTRPDLSGMFF